VLRIRLRDGKSEAKDSIVGGTKVTPEELDEWRRVYPTGGTLAVQALYPHRTRNTIKVTCLRHGIKMTDRYTAIRKRSKRAWPVESDKLIIANYERIGPAGLVPLLLGRSYSSICMRAGFLGCRRSKAAVLDDSPKSRRAALRELFTAPQRVPA
jgi:hypothetical protein